MSNRLLVCLAIVALVTACSKSPSKAKNSANGDTNSATNNVGTNNGTTGEFGIPISPPSGPDQLDLLFVIDNSGSMCQEQKILRENFEQLVGSFEGADLDFQLGITTTDMEPDYALEPVAEPGHLQSTPQPVPGFDRSCHSATDDAGQLISGDYSPIRDAIAAAVGCMSTPDEQYNNVSNADIECALYGMPTGCSIARAGCGGGDPCAAEDLFPAPDAYRTFPRIIRARDYRTGTGSLDVEALRADFACMALVGTRGHGIERGLDAAVRAVSPGLTAAGAPNEGLLREDAAFGLVFVTDENDCSHDGTLNADSPCGGDVCAFANKEGVDSPLVPTAELKEALMANLRESKGDPEFEDTDIVVASIHGNYDRFDGDVPTDAECNSGDYMGISPSCATSLGQAFSGDRYERFLRQFPDGHFYPAANPTTPDARLTGWMCAGDFRPALAAIGEFLTDVSDSCIVGDIAPCEAGDTCPDHPITGEAGSCTQRPDGTGSYCDSRLQVRAVASDGDALTNLQESGYCLEGSLDLPELPDGCVVSPTKYAIEACEGGRTGLAIAWTDENEARNAFIGTDLYLWEVPAE